MNSLTLFKFQPESDLSNWQTIQDVVMGGVSTANFKINKEGYGEYTGSVSLENNGGFSSLHYKFNTKNIEGYSKVVLKLKGDGKIYQFRLKEKQSDKQAYITKFSTTGDWQTITVDLNTLYPTFRGKRLDLPNFDARQIEQIAFLIANKKQESFQLILSSIELIA